MALRSMTGYGRGEAAGQGLLVDVELSSVNRKQLEVKVALPRSLTVLESRLVETVQEALSRGHVTGAVAVQVSRAARERSLRIDHPLAGAYIRRLRSAAAAYGLADDLKASILLALPEVIQWAAISEDADRVWPLIRRALERALKDLTALRETEGAVLAADLRSRLARLAKLLQRIRTFAPRITEKHRRQLLARLSATGLSFAAQDPQILREVALFADRCDISEEITRLESHLRQAGSLLRSRESVGRTLDFLAQEMFREINTIGSKANDVRITRVVIHFKTELERVREQVQNVE